MLTMNTQSRFLTNFDEARQLMHSAVFRPAVKGRIIDARFACLVSRHRPELDAPAGYKPRIAFVLGHLKPAFILPVPFQDVVSWPERPSLGR